MRVLPVWIIGLGLLSLSLAIAPVIGASDGDTPVVAIGIDISGSMRQHGFKTACAELMKYLHQLKTETHLFIVPFAENDFEPFSATLTPSNRNTVLTEAQAFVNTLRPGGKRGDTWGFKTNIDEGIDACLLLAQGKPGGGKRTVVLISDGISDPDATHEPIDILALARKIPRSTSIYLVDLSSSLKVYPKFSPIDNFKAYRLSGFNVFVLLASEESQFAQTLERMTRLASLTPTITQQPASDGVTPHNTLWQRLFIGGLLLLSGVCIGFVLWRKYKPSAETSAQSLSPSKPDGVDGEESEKEFLCVEIHGAKGGKTWPIVPFSTWRVGTDSDADIVLDDPHQAVIDAIIRIEQDSTLTLCNLNSTFPFIVNESVRIDPQTEHPISTPAQVSVSKQLTLSITIKTPGSSTTDGVLDRLLKRYAPTKESDNGN